MSVRPLRKTVVVSVRVCFFFFCFFLPYLVLRWGRWFRFRLPSTNNYSLSGAFRARAKPSLGHHLPHRKAVPAVINPPKPRVNIVCVSCVFLCVCCTCVQSEAVWTVLVHKLARINHHHQSIDTVLRTHSDTGRALPTPKAVLPLLVGVCVNGSVRYGVCHVSQARNYGIQTPGQVVLVHDTSFVLLWSVRVSVAYLAMLL